jgi:hypothetical protein
MRVYRSSSARQDFVFFFFLRLFQHTNNPNAQYNYTTNLVYLSTAKEQLSGASTIQVEK